MKKITRANFEGLRQRYPVLNKEEMRRYVGGNSTLYDESDLALFNVYTLDLDINACSAVGSDKDDEMEEDVWSSEQGISAFSSGGYGSGGYNFYGGSGGSYGGSYDYGGYGWDIDYGYLDEVVIYGNKPNNDYYSGGNNYPGWGDGYGDGDGYWYVWDYSSSVYPYDSRPFEKVDEGRCLAASILNACAMLGMAEVTMFEIKQSLSKYWRTDINRYEISESEVKSVLNEYFDVQVPSSLAKLNNHLAQGKPVLARVIIKTETVGGVNYTQQHDVIMTGMNNDSYQYYDPTAGVYESCTSNQFQYTGLYILNKK